MREVGLITSQNDTAPKQALLRSMYQEGLITSQNDTAPKLKDDLVAAVTV